MYTRGLRLLAAVLLCAAWISGAAAPAKADDAPSLDVSSCLVGSHKNLVQQTGFINAGLLVTFKNNGPETFKRIVWRARYGDGWIDFNDIGTFSPGADVVNGLYILNGVYVLNPTVAGPPMPFVDYQNKREAADCAPVLTESTAGVVWSRLQASSAPYHIPDPLNGEDFPDFPGPGNREVGFERVGLRWQNGAMPATSVRAADTGEPPISVSSCHIGSHRNLVVNSNGLIDAGMVVKFKNTGTQPYTRIVWRARYGNGYIDFNDEGDFAPNLDIVNALWIRNRGSRANPEYPFKEYENDFELADCAPTLIEGANGVIWSRRTPGEPTFSVPEPFASRNADRPGASFGSFGLKWQNAAMP